jgi:hypothetical protein
MFWRAGVRSRRDPAAVSAEFDTIEHMFETGTWATTRNRLTPSRPG